MDLHEVDRVVSLLSRHDMREWNASTAWLAGGTWLFSEPQPELRTLLDLTGFAWPSLTQDDETFHIAATCSIAHLSAFAPPKAWSAATLIPACCRAFLGSFKILNMATVGGNICLALPAAPMLALTVALDGTALIWAPDHTERRLPILDFVTGARRNALRAGELLRAIEIPITAFRKRATHRRMSLTALGQSAALLIGIRDGDAFALTITASTSRPVRLEFLDPPSPARLASTIEAAIPDALYHDDGQGRPAWRRHLTFLLAEEIRAELFGTS